VYAIFMIRSQIYLSEEQRSQLAKLAARTGENMSELIREAIDHYLSQEKNEKHARKQAKEQVFEKAFGMWEDNPVDFAAIRSSADRV
jgi:predicted DNA-binding protein